MPSTCGVDPVDYRTSPRTICLGCNSKLGMSSPQVHPSRDQIEAAAFGHLDATASEDVQAHAAGCTRCARLLAKDQEVAGRLAVLTQDDPPAVDIVDQVLNRLDAHEELRPVSDKTDPPSVPGASGDARRSEARTPHRASERAT